MFIAQNKTETCTISLFDSQILFCERAGSGCVNAIKHYLKRLWLVAIATIFSKTFKINFLFTSAIAHNWSFFSKLKQTFWSIYRVPFHLKCFKPCPYLVYNNNNNNNNNNKLSFIQRKIHVYMI